MDNVTARAKGWTSIQRSCLELTIFADALTPSVFRMGLSRSAIKASVMNIGGLPDIHDAEVNVISQRIEVTVLTEN